MGAGHPSAICSKVFEVATALFSPVTSISLSLQMASFEEREHYVEGEGTGEGGLWIVCQSATSRAHTGKENN